MSKLDIVYQSSAAYAIPAAVSLCSLFENNKKADEINIRFIDGGLTDEDKEKLEELATRYNRSITFLSGEYADKLLGDAGVELWSGSYATFYKVFTCGTLNDLDRVLYIDSDTVVLGDLSELAEIDLDGYGCGMVGSGMTGRVKEYIDCKDYFNAGVILFNLKYWRENNVSDQLLEVIKGEDHKKYTVVADETLINHVLKGKIKKLPLKYNVESSWGRWGWNEKLYPCMGWNSPDECYYSQDEIKEARKAPVIGHYVDLTTGRPWDYLNDNPFRKEFEEYMAVLKPWKTIDFAMRGIGGDSKLIAWIKFFIKKLLPRKVRSNLAFSQHDSAWKNTIEEMQK